MVSEPLPIWLRNYEDNKVREAAQQRQSLIRHFTEEDAINLSNFARYYVNPSPELAAGIAQARIPWDLPPLGDLAWEDAKEQERPWWDLIHQTSRFASKTIVPTVRTLAATAEAVWEEGLPRLFRTGIQQYQNPGQSPVDSWRAAGSSDLAAAIGEWGQGNRVHWGTGLFPQPQAPWEQPGFGTEFQTMLRSDVEMGADPVQAYRDNFNALVEDYEGRFGRDIVYDAQRLRENTIISKTRGGETYSTPFSFGRAAAIQVAAPGSAMFNFISAGIDGYARIAWDPLNIPAMKLQQINAVRDLIVPANAADAGLVTYKSKWVNPRTADDWLRTGRGQRRIQYLVNSENIDDIRAVTPGMDLGDQLRLVNATSTGEVIGVLKPYMSSPHIAHAPVISRTRILGNRIRNSNGFVSHMLPEENSIMGSLYRRMTASSGDVVINVYDADRTADSMLEYLNTVEATVADKNRLVARVLDAANDPFEMNRVVEEFKDVVVRRLGELGYDEEEVRKIMEQFTNLQEANREYLINLAGEAIEMQGSGNYVVTGPDGAEHLLRLQHGAHDAEIAMQMVVLPNMRNVRLATSRVRAWAHQNLWRRRMGWEPKGASVGETIQFLDHAQSVWRNFALIRGGWTIRIVGEEAIRRQAAGYGMMLEHPLQAIAFVTDSNMKTVGQWAEGSVETFDDFIEAKGLGASGFRVDREYNPMAGTRHDYSRANWTVQRATQTMWVPDESPAAMAKLMETGQQQWKKVTILNEAGRRGLMAELEMAVHSHIHTYVEQMSVDELLEFAQTQEGLAFFKALKDDVANVSNPWGRIYSRSVADDGTIIERVDTDLLRQQFGYTELDQARLAGGDGIYQAPDSDEWLDLWGNPIRDPRKMTNDEIKRWLGTDEAWSQFRRSPGGQFRSTQGPEALSELYEMMGLPNLDEIESLGYKTYVTDRGSEAVHRLIETGDSMGDYIPRKPKVSITDEALDGRLASTNLQTGEIRIDRSQVVIDYDNDIAHLRGLDGTTTGEVQRLSIEEKLGVDLDDLKRYMDENGGHLAYERFIVEHERAHAALHKGQAYPGINTDDALEMEVAANKVALEEIGYLDRPQTDAVRINGDMNWRDRMRTELDLDKLYEGGYIPPAHVRMPAQMASSKLARNKRQMLSDFAFKWLGERPTMNLIRSPFAKVRYTEEIAKVYIWADDATRARLLEFIDETGFRPTFDSFVDKHLMQHGLKELPTGVEAPFDNFDELDTIIRNKVVEDTKDLFYDLSRKQNWADSLRLIFPFADAWQEVLSRWMKAMSGTGVGGPAQAMRNWERLRQGTQAASRSGFFEEDQFGNQTFNFPAFGKIFPALESVTRWSIRPEQLMFIDPTIRGIAGPGTGPLVQVAAAYVKPRIKEILGQEAADTMDAFLFGEYVSPELSSAGRLAEVTMPTWMKRSIDMMFDDDNQAALSDEIVQVMSALLHSQDPRFVPYDRESMNQIMQQAQQIGSQLGMARILDAMILPALPRYEPGVFVDIADHPDGGFWLNMAALGAEYRKAEETFGDPEPAIQYILETFGLNPLNTMSKTYSVRQYPTTQEGLAYLTENPELKSMFTNTMMMFIPEGDDSKFYYSAWSESLAEGARQVTTPEMAAQIPSRANGRADWNQRQAEYDQALEQAAQRFGTDSQRYRNYRDNLDDWLRREKYRIDAMYWSWDSPVAGQVERPTYQDLYDELKDAATPGKLAHEKAMELNPELTGFLTFATDLWAMLEEDALNRGVGHDWWRTSEATSPELAEEVFERRQWFTNGITQYINGMEGQARVGAEWVTEYVFSRLIAGAEWDEEVFIKVEEPMAPMPASPSEPLDIDAISSPLGLEE